MTTVMHPTGKQHADPPCLGMLLMAKSLFTTPKKVQTDKVLVTTSESGSIFRPPDTVTQEKEMARAPYGTGR